MKKVELINVSKSYDRQKDVISNIDVTIEPGEFFVLVGPSGCGKSTMLRMIAGLEEITGGTLKIGEKMANRLPPSRRDLSMVFQNYALYPHLSVEDNITFGLDVKKVPKAERKRRAMETAEMLGLTDYLKRKPRELSGGQRQRVALARAIVSEAPICLMDEPLSNLDAKLRGHMRSEIRRIQKRLGITMIYVTHDQVEAMTMGDRIMILHDGKIQQIGSPVEIYNHPANPFVATFIGSPPMNLAEAEVRKNEGLLVLSNGTQITMPEASLDSITDERVTLGIRPEFLMPPESGEGLPVFEAEVTNVEVLGHETVFSFVAGEGEWTAKWSGQWQIQAGDRIPIAVDTGAACLFSLENGGLVKKAADRQRTVTKEGAAL